ncbi:MAG: hypothetical protein ACOH5I_18495 [Oligoflexus sp.]
MKRLGALFLISIMGLMACSQAPQLRRGGGEKSLGRTAADIGIEFLANDDASDAYQYTFGRMPFRLYPAIANIKDGDELGIEWERVVLLRTSEQKNLDQFQAHLEAVCRDMGLSLEADGQIEDRLTYRMGEPLFLFWRSYYATADKQALTQLLLDGVDSIQCVLSLKMTHTAGTFTTDIILDPLPKENTEHLGTQELDLARQELITLIDPSLSGTILIQDSQWQKISVTQDLEIKPEIPALNRKNLSVQDENVAGSTACRYHSLGGELKLGNPEEQHSFEYRISGPSDLQINQVRLSSSGGRSLEACQDVKTRQEVKSLAMDLSCATYDAIELEDKAGACAWTAEIVNQLDPQNTIPLSLRLGELNLDTIDISNPQGAAAIIPESERNPIRLQTLDVSTFNSAQIDSLERAFDFWLGASPASYNEFFENAIARIIYEGTVGEACSEPGVLAYVTSLDTDEMYWCESAGMSAEALAQQNSPLVIMLITVTALHEALHAIGREHDFDALNYEACKGTSESAVLAYDTALNCKEDFCYAMKDLAIREYIVELDYSLEGDARRFAGQCQIWNQGLGLTQNNFGT